MTVLNALRQSRNASQQCASSWSTIARCLTRSTSAWNPKPNNRLEKLTCRNFGRLSLAVPAVYRRLVVELTQIHQYFFQRTARLAFRKKRLRTQMGRHSDPPQCASTKPQWAPHTIVLILCGSDDELDGRTRGRHCPLRTQCTAGLDHLNGDVRVKLVVRPSVCLSVSR